MLQDYYEDHVGEADYCSERKAVRGEGRTQDFHTQFSIVDIIYSLTLRSLQIYSLNDQFQIQVF